MSSSVRHLDEADQCSITLPAGKAIHCDGKGQDVRSIAKYLLGVHLGAPAGVDTDGGRIADVVSL